jgi:tripartite-type tricarboxylate transporter receptor subunit TctC
MSRLARTLMTVMAPVMALAGAPALAVDYPVKPVKVIVSFPPGGLTDVVARLLSQRLSERLKQPVIVENKPGAGGVIGTEFTAKSAPDGYTMTFTANNHVIQPHLSKSLRYDARKDFTPIALVGYLPSAFIVHPSLPVTTIAQMIAHARANPGKLAYGSWGVGTAAHVRTEMFKAENNLDILHVPFQGAGPALTGVVAGQIQLMTIPLSLVEGNHKAGQVRMIGVTTAKRSPAAPDVATFTEQGQSLSGASWQGFVGPAGVPADIVSLLNREITAMVEEPQMRATLAKNGLEAGTATPQQFRAYLDSEFEYWGKAIRTAKVPVE